jgi:hypothetical protein
MNFLAMRLGPGKHLKGLTLMGGLVKPEEFDYFHEVSLRPLFLSSLISHAEMPSSSSTSNSPASEPAVS